MGKKLTAQEIDAHIEQNPGEGFDICSCCGGVEHAGSMKSIDEDTGDFELICDECSHLEKTMDKQVEDAVDLLFMNSHGIAGTKHGDITPTQHIKLQQIKSDLKQLILEQTVQNLDAAKPQESGKKLFLFIMNPDINDLAEGNETKTFEEIEKEYREGFVYSDYLFDRIEELDVDDTIDHYNDDLYGFEIKRIK